MISLRRTAEGSYLRTNAAFARCSAAPPTSSLGVPLADLTHPDDRERDAARFGQLAQRRDVVARLREALPAHRRPDRPRLDHQLGRPRRARRAALPGHPRPRHQRPAARAGRAGAARPHRHPDRPGQPHAAQRPARPGAGPAAARRRRRCAMLLLDIDRFKTGQRLARATRSATRCWSRSPGGSRRSAAPTRRWPGSAVTSSSCWSRGCTDARRGARHRRPAAEALRRPYRSRARRRVAGRHGQHRHLGRHRRPTARTATSTARPTWRSTAPRTRGRDQYALFDDELRAARRPAAGRGDAAAPRAGRRPAGAGLPADRRPDDGRIRAAEALARIHDGDAARRCRPTSSTSPRRPA